MQDETRTPPETEASTGADRTVFTPLPGGRDHRRALRVYVAGRNRFWTADEKRSAAEELETPSRPRGDGSADIEQLVRSGVAVPGTLQFHRAAGTWRDEVPGGRRRPPGSRID